jgi:beta-glucosidase
MNAFQPQYLFGHGLSYSTVETSGIEVVGEVDIHIGDDIELEVTLVNTGNRPSSEVVMVFAQDRVASITPSVDKLKAYKRVIVDAGATEKVRLSVSTLELGFIGHGLSYVIEPGEFGLRVQDQVVDIELNK